MAQSPCGSPLEARIKGAAAADSVIDRYSLDDSRMSRMSRSSGALPLSPASSRAISKTTSSSSSRSRESPAQRAARPASWPSPGCASTASARACPPSCPSPARQPPHESRRTHKSSTSPTRNSSSSTRLQAASRPRAHVTPSMRIPKPNTCTERVQRSEAEKRKEGEGGGGKNCRLVLAWAARTSRPGVMHHENRTTRIRKVNVSTVMASLTFRIAEFKKI